MKVVTLRIPDALAAAIDAESRARGVPKSFVLRERLRLGFRNRQAPGPPAAISDLVGSVEGRPPDLSERTKQASRE